MKAVRILQISDLHGNTSFIDDIAGEIESANIVALAGDITNFGGKRRAAEIVDRVLSLNPCVAAVPGNCDRGGVATYLEEKGVSVDGVACHLNGLCVCGMGGSLPGPAPTPNEFSEKQLAARLEKFLAENDPPDIAIIHQPPINSALDRVSSGAHVGSNSVRDFIERSGAIACLTGHIHESIGIDIVGNTKTVNPGPAVHGRYAIIEIQDRMASVELKITGS